jgi:hypothetical protein
LQKLRKKEANGVGSGQDGADGKPAVGTPKAKTPRKRPTPANGTTSSAKRGRKGKSANDDDGGDDPEETPSKKPKIEVKDE